MKKKHILTTKEYRNIGKMNSDNDGSRSLNESIMSTEVIKALEDWKENGRCDCVIIGGVALSYYIKPRMTADVDVLFLSKDDIPTSVTNFKRNRPSAFQHNQTHVEIELITPSLINVPVDVIKVVFDTAEVVDDIKVASPSGIVALKLFRFSRQDQADIEQLINYTNIDISNFNLPNDLIEKYKQFVKEINKI